MDAGERESSDAASSVTDFYGFSSPAQRLASNDGVRHDSDASVADRGDAGEDSSSDMDVSSSAPSPSPPPVEQPANKRKIEDGAEGVAKKTKLSPPPGCASNGTGGRRKELPVELWQYIFIHLSPAILCRCLRVCRAFHTYLTDTKPGRVAQRKAARSKVLESNYVWMLSRRDHFTTLPRPLAHFSELQMLQLIGGKSCQFCHRQPVPSPCTTPFNSGPGADGSRVIWPFGIRTCGLCLEKNTQKDVEILQTTAGAFRDGLPHIFLTPELHYVPGIQRTTAVGIPSHLRVSKVYSRPDKAAIQQEFEDVRELGPGAAEEWRKGLVAKGKDAMSDAVRWEQWESQVQYRSDLSLVLREYDALSFPHSLDEAKRRSASAKPKSSTGIANGTHHVPHSLPAPVVAAHLSHPLPLPLPPPPSLPQPTHQVRVNPAPRVVRSPREIEAARHDRKAGIERRCLELDPPLEPKVLQHMPSFQAATQIPRALTDTEWENLKPRILAQREDAELVEHEKAEQLAALQAAVPSSVSDVPFIRPAKEVYDKDYENAQEPLRKRLQDYATSYIDNHWNGARELDRFNAPVFAIKTILHIRERYLEDKRAGLFTPNVQDAKERLERSTPIPEPFLSLDNMKSVHDSKIRPLTDSHRRDLFLCEGCVEEQKSKWFAFEGLIQHYGAKHTSDFSKGNIVVHWQTAEWPEEPPFHTDPSSFLKPERQSKRVAGHARQRNALQATHEAPLFAPAPGILLSENPYFTSQAQPQSTSTGQYTPASLYPPSHFEQFPPQTGYHDPSQISFVRPQPRPEEDNIAQLDKISNDAHELWAQLEGIKDMLECIRVHTLFHHVVARFQERFRKNLDLDLVTDALATNNLMKPVKNAHGLACKICAGAQTNGSAAHASYYGRISNLKLYNTSSLVTHFKIVHEAQTHGQHLDWTREMIELPEKELVCELLHTPGMDDSKLAIVAAAFPEAFPIPLPEIGLIEDPPPTAVAARSNGLANRLLDRFSKGKSHPVTKKKRTTPGTGRTPNREESLEPLPEPNEDEYDPRRPMLVKADDAARFDTDLARKPAATTSLSSAQPFSLTPETLAALNSLSGLNVQTQPPINEDRDRSPSVGRAESAVSIATLPQQSTQETQSAPAPDISAILASLTGQKHPASTLPITSGSVRPHSAHRHSRPPTSAVAAHLHAPPLRASSSTTALAEYHDESRSSRRGYRGSDSVEAGPIIHAPGIDRPYERQSLGRSTAQHTEQPPHSPFQPHQTPSPPHYRYIYDENQLNHPSAQQHHDAATSGLVAPVQYIQLHPHQASGHPPPPKPMYVDQYGRQVELIPVHAAPAPVQYAPLSFVDGYRDRDGQRDGYSQHQPHDQGQHHHHHQQQQQQQQQQYYMQQYATRYQPPSPGPGSPPPLGQIHAQTPGSQQQQQYIYYEQQPRDESHVHVHGHDHGPGHDNYGYGHDTGPSGYRPGGAGAGPGGGRYGR